jgi:hypothetical protein
MPIYITASLVAASAVAASFSVPGAPGANSGFNVTWLDLSTITSFTKGQKLHFYFQGSDPKEVVVRFVPKNCSFGDPCEISCDIQHIEKHHLMIKLDQDYVDIKQISVHAGVNGVAFFCPVDGGQVPSLGQVRVEN